MRPLSYPERLLVFRFSIVIKKKLFSTSEEWIDEPAEQSEIDQLDAIAQGAGLPTLGEYYRDIQADRAANKSFENAAHEMVSSWTHRKPTKELLAQFRSDLETKYSQVQHYKHGWHYIVDVDGKNTYYRCQNTEVMLRSFILPRGGSGPRRATNPIRVLLASIHARWNRMGSSSRSELMVTEDHLHLCWPVNRVVPFFDSAKRSEYFPARCSDYLVNWQSGEPQAGDFER